jgi:hypothetical protein
MYCSIVLDSPVRVSTLLQSRGVIEETGSESLANWYCVSWIRVRDQGNFRPFHQVDELLPDGPGTTHRSVLYKVFIAPLNGIVCLYPSVPDSKQR